MPKFVCFIYAGLICLIAFSEYRLNKDLIDPMDLIILVLGAMAWGHAAGKDKS